MAGEWSSVVLGKLAAERDGAIAIGPFGSAMRAETYAENGVRVIRGTNISDTRAWKGDWVFIPDSFADAMPRCVAYANDLVFPHRGAIGEVALVPDDEQGRYFLSTSLMKITLDTRRVDPLFVYYYFRSEVGRSEILSFASQVGTPGIGQPLSSLRQFKVPLPPLNEQNAIATLLGGLDDKIELNRRTAETLEAMARALFKSWFVDFDPVHAKANGRPTGLPETLATLFPDHFDEEDVPAGWEPASIGVLVEVNPPTSLKTGSVAPYVDMAALPTRSARIESWIERSAGSGARFRNGDTLIARITPCLENGKTAIVDFLPDGQVGWGSTEFIVVRPRPFVPPAVPYLLARHEPFRSHLIAAMTGTSGRQRASASAVTAWIIAQPTSPVLRAFGEIIDPLFDRMRAADAENRALIFLRETLLSKLVSGELRIADAEKRISAA